MFFFSTQCLWSRPQRQRHGFSLHRLAPFLLCGLTLKKKAGQENPDVSLAAQCALRLLEMVGEVCMLKSLSLSLALSLARSLARSRARALSLSLSRSLTFSLDTHKFMCKFYSLSLSHSLSHSLTHSLSLSLIPSLLLHTHGFMCM